MLPVVTGEFENKPKRSGRCYKNIFLKMVTSAFAAEKGTAQRISLLLSGNLPMFYSGKYFPRNILTWA